MSLSSKIFLSLLAGLILGCLVNIFGLYENINIGGVIDIPGKIFVSSLKMLIVPVVFFSIVCGISNLGNMSSLGRIGAKSVLLYLFTTCIAITLALIFAGLFSPGTEIQNFEINNFETKQAPLIKDTIINIVPENPFRSFVEANMLQVIFFAIIFGVSLNMLKENNTQLKKGMNALNDLFLKMIEVIMKLAPIGVFFLLFKTFSTQGFDLIFDLSAYFLTVVFTLLIHLLLTYGVLISIFTKINPIIFLKKMKNTLLFAFSTSSSAATIPITLRAVEKNLGVHKSVASFTVPLGATINMDGTAIMQGVATIFIANTYGIDLTMNDFISVILIATLASIGTAGVPGVGLIMLTMVLNQVGLPAEGIAIIIGIDRLLDMTRTAVNVTGDATISCVVANSEKKIDYKN